MTDKLESDCPGVWDPELVRAQDPNQIRCTSCGLLQQVHPFRVGSAVSYAVGSDQYAGTVTEMSLSGHQLTVETKHHKEVFTRRRNGQYRRKGWESQGLLSHGGEDYQDPSF